MFCHVVLYDEHVELPSWSQLQGCSPERLSCSVEVHLIRVLRGPDTRWLFLLTAVQMKPREWPSGCWLMAASPPSLYQEEEAHSDSPLSCFSRFKFWESLEVTRWPGLHWFGPPSTLHSPVKAGLRRRRRRLQEKNTAEEEPVLAADGKRTACEYPIVLIVAGERISKVMLPNEKLITRKYSIPDWMQGIDFFVRSSVFLSRGTGYEGWIVSNIIKN